MESTAAASGEPGALSRGFGVSFAASGAHSTDATEGEEETGDGRAAAVEALWMPEVQSCDEAADSGDAAGDASGAGVAVPVGKGRPVAVDLEQHA